MAIDKYMGYASNKSNGVMGIRDSEDLWEQIIDQIPVELLTKPNVKILNVASGYGTEARILGKKMMSLGVSLESVRESIWVLDNDSVLVDDIRFNSGFKNCIDADFTTWETDMKFDIVVGNPPFSAETKGSHKRLPLYNRFFEKATKLADKVAMIMMDSRGASDKSLDAHNKLIETHGWLDFDCTPYFNVRGNQWCVFWDREKSGTIVASHVSQTVLPDRGRLNFIRGNNKFGLTNSNWSGTYKDGGPGRTKVMNRINSKGVNYTYVDLAESACKPIQNSSPWFVATSERADHSDGGWKYIHKIKNDGQQWTTNVYVFPCESEADADALVEWLSSDEFRSIYKKHAAKSAISKIRTLPSFK